MYRMKRIDTCTHTRQRLRRAHHRSHTHTRFHRIVCNINRSQSIQLLYYTTTRQLDLSRPGKIRKNMAVPKSYFLGGVSVAAWTCEHRSLSYNKRRSSTGRVAFGNRIASSTSNGKKRKKEKFLFLFSCRRKGNEAKVYSHLHLAQSVLRRASFPWDFSTTRRLRILVLGFFFISLHSRQPGVQHTDTHGVKKATR